MSQCAESRALRAIDARSERSRVLELLLVVTHVMYAPRLGVLFLERSAYQFQINTAREQSPFSLTCIGTTRQSIHACLEFRGLELNLTRSESGAEGVGPPLRQRGEHEAEVHRGCSSRGDEAEARSSARGEWAGSRGEVRSRGGDATTSTGVPPTIEGSRARGGGELDADGILAGEGCRPLDLIAAVADVVEPQHVAVVAVAARRHHHAEDLSAQVTGVAEGVAGLDAEALARRGVDAALEAVHRAPRSARAAWCHLDPEGRALNPERWGGAGRGLSGEVTGEARREARWGGGGSSHLMPPTSTSTSCVPTAAGSSSTSYMPSPRTKLTHWPACSTSPSSRVPGSSRHNPPATPAARTDTRKRSDADGPTAADGPASPAAQAPPPLPLSLPPPCAAAAAAAQPPPSARVTVPSYSAASTAQKPSHTSARRGPAVGGAPLISPPAASPPLASTAPASASSASASSLIPCASVASTERGARRTSCTEMPSASSGARGLPKRSRSSRRTPPFSPAVLCTVSHPCGVEAGEAREAKEVEEAG
eukprot:scaffold58520_cov56-Phaeocystis_antarctica.AAC.1